MAELLEAGVELTVIGMSVVFAMLTLLVGAIALTARLCRALGAAAESPAAPERPAAESEPDAEIVGVITAAVQMFRRDRESRHSVT